MSMPWVSVEDRLPDISDADRYDRVIWLDRDQNLWTGHWREPKTATAWCRLDEVPPLTRVAADMDPEAPPPAEPAPKWNRIAGAAYYVYETCVAIQDGEYEGSLAELARQARQLAAWLTALAAQEHADE